jgi:hypothetical protein
MRELLRTSVLSLLLASAGCAGNGVNTAPEPVARARIENRSNWDVDIYLRPAQRPATRLGFVPAADTADFALPPVLITGAGSFTLEARRMRGGRAIASELFTARTGDEIFWSIPP